MTEAAPIRRRRRKTRLELLEKIRLPFHNGIRLRMDGNYPPGTLFVTRVEYFELKKLEKDGKYQTSELDAVAAEMIKVREKREALAKASNKPIVQTRKLVSAISIKEKRSQIKALAKDNSNDLLERFFEKIIPQEVRESLSEEQLEIRKQELFADLVETINSRLCWSFNETWLEAQGRLDSF